jgi:hypothetical protein
LVRNMDTPTFISATHLFAFRKHLSRGHLFDIVFTDSGSPLMRPFPTVKDLHSILVKHPYPDKRDPNDSPHPYPGFLPDDAPVVFTHGDLHRSNITISPPSEGRGPRVLATIN